MVATSSIVNTRDTLYMQIVSLSLNRTPSQGTVVRKDIVD